MFVFLLNTAFFAYILWKLVNWWERTKSEELRQPYSKPGPLAPLKAAFIYTIMTLRKLKGSKSENAGAGYGVKSSANKEQLEKDQPLADNPLAIDAVLFSGGSEDGTYLVLATARRQGGLIQTICMMYVPGIGLLVHKQHPDVSLYQKPGETGWEVDGLKLRPEVPMKRWSVTYQGKMIVEKSESGSTYLVGSEHDVKIDAVYTSDLDYFDFDSDMDIMVVARAMAREKWDGDYFQRLRLAHQNHYEQFGFVQGKLSFNEEEREFKVSVMRDHTHGSTRDWKLMHRYCLHNFTCRSGLRGFLGVVSQPGIFSFLELGYIYTPDKQKYPVQEVDLPIWNYGENGIDCEDFGFRFRAGDKWYNIQVKVLNKSSVYFGEDWDARVIERFCRYEINGEPGWGVSEWEYRHREGRTKFQPFSDN